jgi:predicted ATPase
VQAGYTRIAFRCSPYHTNSALYPVIEHVQRVLQFEPGDTPTTRLDKLERVLKTYSRPLEDVVPLYAALLSVPLPEGRYAPLNLSPQQQRQQTQDALVGWLLEEAECQPTLAMWEDLHWADPSTLELLGIVLEQTPTVPMLHVLAYRPEFEPPWPTRSHMTPITLNRLERPQVKALITHLAGDKTLPDDVVEHIVAKTDGVPLYVEELTKMLLKSDLIREETEQYVLTGPLVGVAIPDTLQDSLMARLDQMHTAKEVAQLGAVLGREFSYEMLQAISSQDEAAVQAGLAQLVEAELLYQRGRPPRATYLFKHALIQDAAYASLLKSTRQRMHQQIAQVVETQPEVLETQPEVLARHYTEGGCLEQAIVYWQRAGQQALQRSANQEAIGHLTTGLALVAALPDTPVRVQQELDMQMTLGPAVMAVKGHAAPEVEQAYTRARELCRQIEGTPQLFPVLWGLWRFYFTRVVIPTSHELGEQLLTLARDQKDASLLLAAHQALGTTLFQRGEYTRARTHLEQGIDLEDTEQQRALAVRYGASPTVYCLGFAARTLWALGYPDQARQRNHEAYTLAQELAHSPSIALTLYLGAYLPRHVRQVDRVREQAQALITLATEQGFALWQSVGMFLQG